MLTLLVTLSLATIAGKREEESHFIALSIGEARMAIFPHFHIARAGGNPEKLILALAVWFAGHTAEPVIERMGSY